MSLIPARFAAETLDLACAIQAIPAPTFHETRRAEFVTRHFQALGLAQVHTDAAGSVLGCLPGRGVGRPLVVSAHMDTVHPLGTLLAVSRGEERITGPGIGDNALGLAALLGLPRLVRSPLPGDLWLAANTCEEGLGNLRGMQGIVDRFGGEPLAYLVLEGMGLGSVLHRGLGVERYRVSVQTPGGHSWVDYGQPSAIHELCAVVARLAALPMPRTPCTTLNVGMISGGTSVNTIASHACMELDLRSEEAAALAAVVREAHGVALAARRPGVDVTFERIGKRASGSLPAEHKLVKLARGVLAELRIEARLDIASTDANLPLSRGYPAICLGITNGNNAHTSEEFILTAPIQQGLLQVLLIVLRAWAALEG